MTVYKALKQARLSVGQWVAITGAGGGLGHLAVQYAVAMGLRVLAIGESTPLPFPRALARLLTVSPTQPARPNHTPP